MAYSRLSRLHHAWTSRGSSHIHVLPTSRGSSASTIQRAEQHIRMATHLTNERRSRRSHIHHDERRMERRRTCTHIKPKQPECRLRPGPRAGTRRSSTLHRSFLGNSHHRSHRGRTSLHHRLEKVPKAVDDLEEAVIGARNGYYVGKSRSRGRNPLCRLAQVPLGFATIPQVSISLSKLGAQKFPFFSAPQNGNTVGLLDSSNSFHRYLGKKRRTRDSSRDSSRRMIISCRGHLRLPR